MELGTAIKLLRKNKGWTQKILSDKSGISVNALCQIEINYSFPKKETIKNICNSLGIPVAYLLLIPVKHERLPEHKQEIFNMLFKLIENLLLEDKQQN